MSYDAILAQTVARVREQVLTLLVSPEKSNRVMTSFFQGNKLNCIGQLAYTNRDIISGYMSRGGRVCIGEYGDVWGRIGAYGDVWGRMGAYGGVWGRMGAYGGRVGRVSE